MRTVIMWLVFAGGFSIGWFAFDADPSIGVKAECELSLPRNQHCVMQYVPEDK